MKDLPPGAKPWHGEDLTTPDEAEAAGGTFLERTLPNVALNYGGELLGGAGGAALGGLVGGPAGAFYGGVTGAGLGAGLGGVIAKHLPQELGGNTDQSDLNAFLWNATPAVAAKYLALRHVGNVGAARDAAQAAREAEQLAALRQAVKEGRGATIDALTLGPRTADDTARVLRAMKAKFGPYSPPIGAERQQATFALRDAINEPINRLRDRYGAPLGAAYEALKGNNKTISEQEAAGLAETASDVKDWLLSPAPQSQGILKKLQSYAPKMGMAEGVEAISGKQKADMTPVERAFYDKLFGGAKSAEELAAEAPKPPTLDELRELRQNVTMALQKATGGDRYALRQLQSAIDDCLVDHLPPNMSQLRADYKSFIKQFPHQATNQLNNLPDEIGVAKWMFGRPKTQGSFVKEIVTEATPAEKAKIQQGFDKFILNQMDFNKPPEAMFKQLQGAIEPYMQNGTMRELFGPRAVKAISDRMYLPMHADALVKILKTPAGGAAFDQGFELAARQSPDLKAAVNKGFEALMDTMSPKDRQAYSQLFRNPPQVDIGGITPIPALGESPQEVTHRLLTERLAKSKALIPREQEGLRHGVAMMTASAATGHMFGTSFAASRVLMLQGGAFKRALLKLAIKSGKEGMLIDMMSKHPGLAGSQLYQLLGAIGATAGSRTIGGAGDQPVDLGDED